MRYIILALTAMVCLGFSDYLVKKAITVGLNVNVLILYNFLISAFFFGALCLLKKVPLIVRKQVIKYAIIIGILIFLATVSIVTALKSGSASVIFPIGRMGFVITAICAFIFLHEKITPRKILGLLFAVVSLILLTQ